MTRHFAFDAAFGLPMEPGFAQDRTVPDLQSAQAHMAQEIIKIMQGD